MFQDIFRSRPAQNPQNNSAPTPPQGPGPNNSPQGNGSVPPTGTNTNNSWAPPSNNGGGKSGTDDNFSDPNNPSGNKSPLDQFADLWQPDNNNGSGKQPTSIFSFDPKKIGEGIGKMNFANAVNPEVMQKALSGDQQAFGQVLNNVGQQVFGQAFTLFHKMMEEGFVRNNGNFESQLNDRFREWGASQELADDPIFQSPAAQPVFEAVKSQLAKKYPDLPPKQIAARAKAYIQALSGGSQSDQSQNSQTQPNKRPQDFTFPAEDFSDFLGT